jgi:hypothetical protein
LTRQSDRTAARLTRIVRMTNAHIVGFDASQATS